MKVDPRLVADPHWQELAAALHETHARRVDVPESITVPLEDGPLTPDAPAADLAGRIGRLAHPEPFAEARTEQRAAAPQVPQGDPQPPVAASQSLGDLGAARGMPSGSWQQDVRLTLQDLSLLLMFVRD